MGHVSVALTPDEIDECIEVVIHGAKHYLHSTTARELSNMLLARLDEWNVIAHDAGYSRLTRAVGKDRAEGDDQERH